MAKLILTNISLKQAKLFADWYEGQGEQDADIWFDIHGEETPMVDVQRKNWLEVDKDAQTVTIHCQSPKKKV